VSSSIINMSSRIDRVLEKKTAVRSELQLDLDTISSERFSR